MEAYVKKIEWHGKPAMLSIGTDITERKQFEETLKQSEEKFRTLFEQNMLAIYLHDVDGNIIDVSTEACSQLGYNRKELPEMSFLILYIQKNLAAICLNRKY